MYEAHFGFTGSPFQLNPDPSFYFGSRGHSNALAYLKFGAHQGEGFIVVTGEIGAGKTTLVRTLLEGLDPDQVTAAQVVSTQLESGELLQAILMAFGVAAKGTSKAHLIATLEGFLTTLAAKGRRALLIIDEAQNLKHEAVEELRMLSNFQLGNHGLLQSFLVGQPELRGLLQSKSMEQLRQRVIASCHLGPLDAAETKGYIEHRLRRVGWDGTRPELAIGVVERIHQWTDGVPRRINRLCNRLLLGAFLADAKVVGTELVDETASALKAEIGEAEVAAFAPSPLADASAPRAPAAATLDAPQPKVGSTQAVQTAAPSGTVEGLGTIRGELRAAAAASVGASVGQALAAGAAARGGPASERSAPKRKHKGANKNRAASSLASATPRAETVGEQTVAQRVGHSEVSTQPILCLVNSASEYLKSGLLADVFRAFPSLPSVVAVHPGVESDLAMDLTQDWRMPPPALVVHLGITADSYAARTSKLSDAFDALLSEFEPRAIMVVGSSDTDLACSLLARKRGIALLRAGAGQRTSHRASNKQMNAALIEKIADVLYTDSTESFYALYREGIHLDRVCSVGSLTREMLDNALLKSSGAPAPRASAIGVDTTLPSGPCGLISIDPRDVVEPDSLRHVVKLLCEMSRDLPLLWMLSPQGRSRLEYSSCVERIDAAKISLVPTPDIRQALGMLRTARCLIATQDGDWLPEARALGLPSLVLGQAASFEADDATTGESAVLGKAAVSDRATFAHWLAAPNSAARAPDYWDGGTATRIASHLVGWMSKQTAAASQSANETLARLAHA